MTDSDHTTTGAPAHGRPPDTPAWVDSPVDLPRALDAAHEPPASRASTVRDVMRDLLHTTPAQLLVTELHHRTYLAIESDDDDSEGAYLRRAADRYLLESCEGWLREHGQPIPAYL